MDIKQQTSIIRGIACASIIVAISGCNMPTHPDQLIHTPISSNTFTNLNCEEIHNELNKLRAEETGLVGMQQKRIRESQGHSLFYGWGKGNGFDTVELVKTRSKIHAAEQQLANNSCKYINK